MTSDLYPFREFPKIARLCRDVIVTEKIDGTNAQIFITEGGPHTNGILHHWVDEASQVGFVMFAGSRTRWITPENDNYGFARWAKANAVELQKLGRGQHFGEWWGQGIQRGYGLKEKRFSLFNVSRWCSYGQEPQRIPTSDPRVEKFQDVLPGCCGLVPVLYRGPFATGAVDASLDYLRARGSEAAPGFSDPEGVVVFHTAAGICFKRTLKNDDTPKALSS